MGSIFNFRNSQVGQSVQADSVTLGTVIATNDPHQMGRLKVLCPKFGDDPNDATGSNLPWASYMSPMAGMTNTNYKRGPAGIKGKGPIPYGFWNIPKRGSTVLICCVDGDPYYRVWLGSIFDQGCVSSLPHGRFFYQSTTGAPDGPFDAYENSIEPYSTNLTTAFGTKLHNYEYRTRGADFSAGGNNPEFTDMAPSPHADETTSTPFLSEDGKSFDVKNGYAVNPIEGVDDDDNSVYSWTTPGFHSISMDDRPENCRVRVRTSAGAQVLMDDTNERIYINTPQGNNWIEMDYWGNIDMYGRTISMSAEQDINFTAKKTIRLFGAGIHLMSTAELNLQSTSNLNMKSGADALITAGGQVGIGASGNLTAKGAMIDLNGAEAPVAEDAKWTMRLPSHEPFTRTMTASDNTHDPELTYDDPNVGLIERGVTIPRGKYWRR